MDHSSTTCEVKRLNWDSEFFGFPVASVDAAGMSDAELGEVLAWTRREGIAVAYVTTSPSCAIAANLVLEFGGQLVDKKATFSRELDPAQHITSASDLMIEDYPVKPPEESLQALAEAAGAFSRFRVDTRFGVENWRRLYHAWVANSTRRTIADAVLIARTAEGRLAGFITFRCEGESGSIGLIAVAEEARGLGFGRRLLKAAERRCAQRGVRRLSVTTQFHNDPACGLYRSANYTLSSLVYVYHFWL